MYDLLWLDPDDQGGWGYLLGELIVSSAKTFLRHLIVLKASRWGPELISW